MLAVKVMSALAQATRLEVFRLLVDRLPDGIASGELAAATKTTPNTMSAHLAILARAGLVKFEKVGRTVVYRADTAKAEDLAAFLSAACERGKTGRR